MASKRFENQSSRIGSVVSPVARVSLRRCKKVLAAGADLMKGAEATGHRVKEEARGKGVGNVRQARNLEWKAVPFVVVGGEEIAAGVNAEGAFQIVGGQVGGVGALEVQPDCDEVTFKEFLEGFVRNIDGVDIVHEALPEVGKAGP